MPLIGHHMSIAGGFERAVERAQAVGGDCVQIFSKNNSQWRARDITEHEVLRFRNALETCAIAHPIIHASYLINLASPDRELRHKSIDALVVELQRGARLGIPHVVVHPGAHTTASEKAGLKNVVRAVNEIFRQTRRVACSLLLETTAGQGTALGWRFEQLAAVLQGVREPERLGVCFDTCHVFAAGYDLRSPSAYEKSMADFARVVGWSPLRAVHLNDSVGALGSRLDRHAHIGYGKIGRRGFRLLLRDPRLAAVPMYLETAKGERDGEDWDVINLRALRKLSPRVARS